MFRNKRKTNANNIYKKKIYVNMGDMTHKRSKCLANEFGFDVIDCEEKKYIVDLENDCENGKSYPSGDEGSMRERVCKKDSDILADAINSLYAESDGMEDDRDESYTRGHSVLQNKCKVAERAKGAQKRAKGAKNDGSNMSAYEQQRAENVKAS